MVQDARQVIKHNLYIFLFIYIFLIFFFFHLVHVCATTRNVTSGRKAHISRGCVSVWFGKNVHDFSIFKNMQFRTFRTIRLCSVCCCGAVVVSVGKCYKKRAQAKSIEMLSSTLNISTIRTPNDHNLYITYMSIAGGSSLPFSL